MALKKIVSIEGNIASGKSSLLHALTQSQLEKIFVSPERLDLWENYRGCNLLELAYNAPFEWAFKFQVYVQHTIAAQVEKFRAQDKQIMLAERSLAATKQIFIPLAHAKQTITHIEHDILQDLGEQLERVTKAKPDVIIYVQTSPEIAYRRCVARRRGAERNNVNLPYLRQLHNFHENWLGIDGLEATKIFLMDGNLPFEQVCARFRDIVDVIIRQE